VYEKLHAKGPHNSSTQFMADTVKTVEKHKLLYPTTKPVKNDDVIWKIERRATQNTTREQGPVPKTTDNSKNNRGASMICYNCNKPGHVKKDCKTCSFCGVYGHTAKQCAERIAKAKGKYCHTCKISDSHNTQECYRNNPRAQPQKASGINNVRMVLSEGNNVQDVRDEDTWASPFYDSNEEEAGREVVSNQY
jgi:hypothetical protein